MQQLTQDGRRRIHWYHPGEVVVVARVANDAVPSLQGLHGDVHRSLSDRAPGLLAADAAGATRSFAFTAPNTPQSLVFFFHKLAERDDDKAVKAAVKALQQGLGPLHNSDIDIISAMPHVHMRNHEDASGPSPGSLPRPVYADQVPYSWDYPFYQPISPRLDLARDARNGQQVRVAVLDTMPNLDRALEHGKEIRNEQLTRTIERLRNGGKVHSAYELERAAVEQHHGHLPELIGSPSYPVADHGLFISGLIGGIAPNAALTLEPVLGDTGVGDLSYLLTGLQLVLERKKNRPELPQIINLSLGFLPHPARLPAAWYGLDRKDDPHYFLADELYDPEENPHWVAANRTEVNATVDMLEAGLRELARYLRLNNCLVVAAAGNDSLAQVEAHRGRMEPRLPARFETVLGVAATTSDPRRPARYSNVGDERELGDHVATFGGDASDALEPEGGVMGIYSGEFPDKRPNETGWAFWSGTSFATAIISGIAANLWSVNPKLDAADVLAELYNTALEIGPYVPELRTPSIEVRTRWGRY